MRRSRGGAFAVVALAANVAFGGSASAAEQCAETEFDAFLARFSEDAEVQRRHVQFPLTKVVVEDQGVEGPVPVEKQIQSWPENETLYLNTQKRKAYQLEVTVTTTEQGRLVELEKPDTDFQIFYWFEQRPCWTLVRIGDYSL